MPTANLSFAKIVATPTESAWSQAYNAGGLFIALALSTEDTESQEQLPVIGKKILDTIEAEYFGLEKKDLASIQKVITESVADLDPLINPSLSLTSIKDNILYGFLIGDGRLTLKRGEKVGVILENTDGSKDLVTKSSSGYLENDDIILIQTTQFVSTVPANIILPALEYALPSDIAETITPFVHGKTEGGATAIVLCYKGFAHEPVDEIIPPAHPTLSNDDNSPERTGDNPQTITNDTGVGSLPKTPLLAKLFSPIPHLNMPPITKRKKTILAVALILIGVLIMSIFIVQSSTKSSKTHLLFEQIYNAAKKNYDEGEGLLSVNKPLARDGYEEAKKDLNKAVGVFKTGSEEQKKIDELTRLIDTRLTELEGANKVSAKVVSGDDYPSLQILAKDSSLLASVLDEDITYTISSKTIATVSKAGDKKELIKNNSTWSNPVSLSAFSGNVYVLDTKAGLLKFVPTSSSYGQSSYFKEEAPSLTNAVGMAIDSSIFILFSDGTVQKYTRGVKDSFTLSDVPKNVSQPSALYTNTQVNNIYILDTRSSSLLKFDKTGNFQAQFQSDILKTAKTFVVNDDEKSAFILSGNKIYELPL